LEHNREPKQTSVKERSWRRTALEWLALLGLFLFLTRTHAGTVVRGGMQSVLLRTGIFSPDLKAPQGDAPVLARYDIPVTTLDGTPTSLPALRGSVVFLNLWASWCAPCLAEMPLIQRLYDDVNDSRIIFVMLSVDEDRDAAERLIDARGYTFPVYHLAGPLPGTYSTAILPTTYILSPSGRVAAVHSGMANYASEDVLGFLKGLASQADEPY
jgi:thiol-disulfide isomerase/thioredoxin